MGERSTTQTAVSDTARDHHAVPRISFGAMALVKYVE
jgi:hypothetical protein